MNRGKIIGKNIQIYRKFRDLTQKQLAEAINVSASTIAMYETGKREPDFDKIEAIADVLNVRVSDIVQRSENIQKPIDPVDEEFIRLYLESPPEIKKAVIQNLSAMRSISNKE